MEMSSEPDNRKEKQSLVYLMNRRNIASKHLIASTVLSLFFTIFFTGSPTTLKAQEAIIPPCNGYEKEDDLCRLPVTDIHPTQFSVGMTLVHCRKNTLEKKNLKKLNRYLKKKKNHIPTVIGPLKKFYITDRHHLSRALYISETDAWLGKEQEVVIQVTRNDNQLNINSEEFWLKMAKTRNVYPYDERGLFVKNFGLELSHMTLAELKDDPYRTLSKLVREGCGYIKKSEKKCVALKATATLLSSDAFIEMYWAQYLRIQLPLKGVPDSEQLWQLYPQALRTVLDKKKTGTFFSSLGLDPKEYGQNQTGKHLKLRYFHGGCIKKSNEQDDNQPLLNPPDHR